jgi:hypothetical protein
VNRKFILTTLSRALAVLAALACIAVAIVPGVPAARGAGQVAIAVTSPENDAGASQAILEQVGQAMYDGIVATGRYDVRSGGPLKLQLAPDGDALAAALSAASKVEADEVLITDVVRLANGKIVYRMSIYKVSPLTFGRSQVFQQPFPASDPHVFAAQFGSDLAALEAPRTNTGTIYAVEASGIYTDTGAANGFHLSQRFNVVRAGKKVAEAQINTITDANATVDILNPTPSYQAQVGDLLISQEPGPAIPVGASHSGGNAALDVIALLVGAGAALLAIGHGTTTSQVICPPTCASPSPTGSAGFTVSPTGNSGTTLQPVFGFSFSQPVQGAATFNFGDTTKISVQDQVGTNTPGPPGTLNGFAGATATCSFDPSGQLLTVHVNSALQPGHAYFINFQATIMSTTSVSLMPVTFRYPSSGTLATSVRPMNAVRPANASAPGNGNGGNGGSNGSGPKAPQPQPTGASQPHGGH